MTGIDMELFTPDGTFFACATGTAVPRSGETVSFLDEDVAPPRFRRFSVGDVEHVFDRPDRQVARVRLIEIGGDA